MSKKEKVLEALKERGKEGMHGFELIKYGGWRYAARVHDLKKDGYDILSTPEKRMGAMGARYILLGE